VLGSLSPGKIGRFGTDVPKCARLLSGSLDSGRFGLFWPFARCQATFRLSAVSRWSLGGFSVVLGGFSVVLGGFSVVLGGFSVVLGGFSVVLGGFSVVLGGSRWFSVVSRWSLGGFSVVLGGFGVFAVFRLETAKICGLW
jgi:hypothetical protein